MTDEDFKFYTHHLENEIKNNIEQVIDNCVQIFLLKHKSLIEYAGKNNLYYFIVLKEDNSDNRSIVFEFFHFYDSFEIEIGHPIAEKYPVHFQFVPSDLINKVHIQKEIIIDGNENEDGVIVDEKINLDTLFNFMNSHDDESCQFMYETVITSLIDNIENENKFRFQLPYDEEVMWVELVKKEKILKVFDCIIDHLTKFEFFEMIGNIKELKKVYENETSEGSSD